MAHANPKLLIKIFEGIQHIRNDLETFAQWLETIPPRMIKRLTAWINIYNRTYGFMLDPAQRKEDDEELPQALMKFFIIVSKQVTAIVMAIRAITGIHHAINGKNGISATGGTSE